jgi:putative endonuclease
VPAIRASTPVPRAPARPGGRPLGRLGEDLAAAHLERLGYRVLERNARTRHGEIDLIATGHDALVFVEVKTRREHRRPPRGGEAIEPLAGLRPRQRLRLRRLAVAWLADPRTRRPSAGEIRFDAIGVVLDDGGRLLRLEHLEAAW